MPIYEYQCADCKQVCERKMSIKDNHPPHIMHNCNGDPLTFCEHKRKVSASNFQLAGSGWAKDGYK